jgi:uncharacterized protein (DUF1800 family)
VKKMPPLLRRILWQKSFWLSSRRQCFVGWSALAQWHTPNQSDKLTQDDVRHLLNRTGFAASMAEINALAGLSRRQAADKLLAATREVAITPPPARGHHADHASQQVT